MLRADDVAHYLQNNPKFFEEHAELLAQVYLPHPHGGRAISITERQILTLRERSKQLEAKLSELIRFGEENDAIGEKVHRLALALIAAPDLPSLLSVAHAHLRDDFAVPNVALRLWTAVGGEGPEFEPVSERSRILAAGLAHPYCGPSAGQDAASWFGEGGAHVRSLALVALRFDNETVGMLALGSEDAQRFYPEMGTIFLTRIGELIAAALQRLLD